MFIDFKKILSVLFFIILGIVIGVVGTKIVSRYQAPKQTVSITGTGEIDATTDQATISVQVKNISTTYEKAQEENKKDVTSLKLELKKLGIPESRIATSSYSQPIFNKEVPLIETVESSGSKMMPSFRPETVPTVTTSLTLTIDPIKNIEKIFDTVSKNSNASITNTYYSLKDRKGWESKAKEEALKDARSQVETIAKINRLRVGKLLTVEDGNNPRPYPMLLKGADQAVSSGQETQTVNNNNFYSEQSVKISSSYTATYELY